MLFPDQPGVEVIWTATPRSLFLGIVLYLFETPNKLQTLGQVLRETLVSDDGSAYFRNIILYRELGSKILKVTDHEAITQAENDLKEIKRGKDKADEKFAEMAAWYQLNKSYKNRIDAEGNGNQNIKKFGEVKINREILEIGKALSPACVRSLNSYISIKADKTRGGIITSFRAKLELWMNPLVDAATSANDFDLRDVRKKRMSIYLGVTPDNLMRMAPIFNLFFQQLIDLNTRELPNQNPDIKNRCLLLMDEFTSIGKIGILSRGISYIAGYWLRMMPIIQSPAQLVDVYGKEAAQTFQTNHALNIVFPPKSSETQTARDISEWLGFQTVKGLSKSKRKILFSKPTESISDQRRALMLPQEITGLGKEKELVILENVPPILARKIKYYKEAIFIDRIKQVSKTLGGYKTMPTKEQLDFVIGNNELEATVPKIDLEAHEIEVSKEAPIFSDVQKTKIKSKTIVRPLKEDDAPKLEFAEFTIEFNVDRPDGVFDREAAIKLAEELDSNAYER
jgi:type IV secretion system protein VirD4